MAHGLRVMVADPLSRVRLQAQGTAAEQRGPQKALQLQELAVSQAVRSGPALCRLNSKPRPLGAPPAWLAPHI